MPADVAKLSGFPDAEFLLIEPSPDDIERALDSWKWIGLDGLRAFAVSAFGDVFFRSQDGSVHQLDMIEGRLVAVAPDLPAFVADLQDEELRDEFLLAWLVLGARAGGLILAKDECYDFRVPLVLGGQFSVEQVEKLSFVVRVNLAGQLHEQIKDLPPGTNIDKITIDDQGG